MGIYKRKMEQAGCFEFLSSVNSSVVFWLKDHVSDKLFMTDTRSQRNFQISDLICIKFHHYSNQYEANAYTLNFVCVICATDHPQSIEINSEFMPVNCCKLYVRVTKYFEPFFASQT